jgi:hypothetical protein
MTMRDYFVDSFKEPFVRLALVLVPMGLLLQLAA